MEKSGKFKYFSSPCRCSREAPRSDSISSEIKQGRKWRGANSCRNSARESQFKRATTRTCQATSQPKGDNNFYFIL
jgi:hypothetical protein